MHCRRFIVVLCPALMLSWCYSNNMFCIKAPTTAWRRGEEDPSKGWPSAAAAKGEGGRAPTATTTDKGEVNEESYTNQSWQPLSPIMLDRLLAWVLVAAQCGEDWRQGSEFAATPNRLLALQVNKANLNIPHGENCRRHSNLTDYSPHLWSWCVQLDNGI